MLTSVESMNLPYIQSHQEPEWTMTKANVWAPKKKWSAVAVEAAGSANATGLSAPPAAYDSFSTAATIKTGMPESGENSGGSSNRRFRDGDAAPEVGVPPECWRESKGSVRCFYYIA